VCAGSLRGTGTVLARAGWRSATVSGGRIQGRVFTGGLPLDGSIEAVPVGIPGESDTVFQSDVLEDGRFSLDVPVGRYVLELNGDRGSSYGYSAAGPVSGFGTPDTLVVDSFHDNAHLEFHLASISVPVALSGEVQDDIRVEIRLFRHGFESWYPFSPLLRGDVRLDGNQGEVQLVGVVPGPYRIQLKLTTRPCGYRTSPTAHPLPGTMSLPTPS